MNKEQKRKVQLQQRTLNESLTFQTMFGAKQKFESLTPEIETRIKEDLMTLKDVMDKVKEQLGYSAAPSKGILAGSYVAYCLGLEPGNPMMTGKDIEPKDFQVTLPLGLTICYDNEVRNEVVNWMKEHGCEFTTYMTQPMLKLENTRVIIRRVLK